MSQIPNLAYQTIEVPYIYIEVTIQRNFLRTKEARLTRYIKGDVLRHDYSSNSDFHADADSHSHDHLYLCQRRCSPMCLKDFRRSLLQ